MKRMIIVLSLTLFIAIPGEESFAKGLYLKRGVGIPGFLEIGKKAEISGREELFGEYLYGYGLTFEQHKESGTILTLKCNIVGCKTDNNIGVGSEEKDVRRRFGPPLEEKKFDGADKLFISYDGVAFKIKEGRVTTIYILPIWKKKR